MKTILIPTDFSISADYAIHYAMGLAKQFKSSIILYHAFIPFESGFYSYEKSKKENLETENILIKRLNEIKNRLLEKDKLVTISIYVDRGPENIRLVEFCKKQKISLIVMGTTGASGLKKVIIGSFTADIMTLAPCPVLAIPNGCKYKIPKNITFASNYHNGDIKAIRFLSEWIQHYKTKINILHIDDGEDTVAKELVFMKYKRKIEKQSESIPISFRQIAGTDISAAILNITLNDKTDILALSSVTQKGFWNKLFHKSITKETAYRSCIPLLAIPIK